MRTVVDSILDAAGGDGELTPIGPDGDLPGVPWSEVHVRAVRVAAVLAELGAGPGRRVAFLAATGVDLVAALQGAWL
ncbi:MAG TPA: hypothetical protein VGD67_28815, partial [Pseudonocardiaceae bacterium]